MQITAGAVAGGFASAGMAQLILGAVFPVGLIITVLTGAELFTGDAMLAPMAAFIHKVTWMQVINLWIFVYIGNLIGSLVFAYIWQTVRLSHSDAAWCGNDHCVRYAGDCHSGGKDQLCRNDGHVVCIPQGNCLQLARQPRYPARYLCG